MLSAGGTSSSETTSAASTRPSASKVETVSGAAAQHPRTRLARLTLTQNRSETRLREAARAYLSRRRQRAQLQAERLALLSPVASLDRGWALVRRSNGSVVRRATEVAVGEELAILMHDGVLAARVDRVEPADIPREEPP